LTNILLFAFFRREDLIDAEVRASGLTKQMEKDLLKEIGMEEEKEEEEEEENSDEEIYEDCVESIENLEDRINHWQLEVENAMRESFDEFQEVSRIGTFLDNENRCTERENNTEDECERSNRNITVESTENDKEHNEHKEHNEDNLSDISSDLESKIAYTNDYDDRGSIRSTSTAATIAPDVIKRRMKLALKKREKKGRPRKILAKGEASAVTRTRRENNAMVKESTGIWSWE